MFQEETKRIYSDNQLLYMSSNFNSVHIRFSVLFDNISTAEDGLALHEISKQSEMSEFVRDKCIAALELPGLIEKYSSGTEKLCRLTFDGKRLSELLKEKGRNRKWKKYHAR